ncbi:MAG: MFS transporter [Chloroflexi bacterium]|nr:MFS transporter [Chloroflexota bacterium]
MTITRKLNQSVRARFFHGWLIVGASMMMLGMQATVTSSFGVFFKPLAADFGWTRANTSGLQSVYMLSIGFASVAAGWLADRFGPARVLGVVGVLAGAGLILTSQITALWQMYLTYSILTGIGLCATLPVTGIATSRWFVKRRGLALGIGVAGMCLGQLIGVMTISSLILAYGWSNAYLVLGAAVGAVFVSGAFVLRRRPEQMGLRPYGAPAAGPDIYSPGKARTGEPGAGAALLAAIRTRTLWMLFVIFALFTFVNQMIVVHVVNYATDLGIAPLVAATIISGVGLSGFIGRVLMGAASDRIGNMKTLVIACLGIAPSLVLLVFARDMWVFYLFAMVYGFSYGAEMPQQSALIGKFFGLRVMLVGILQAGACIGGALGAWTGGKIFDITNSYELAFLTAAAAVVLALALIVMMGRRPANRVYRQTPAGAA